MSFRSRSRGFSLLEVLVAFSIAALALGMLYQVMGTNARQAGGLGQQERALVLAESLLSAHATVPPEGVNERAKAAGFDWQVQSRPFPTPANSAPQAPRLQELLVSVQWLDGSTTRNYEVSSLRPESLPQPRPSR